MNKLRILSHGGGGLIALVALWAAVSYAGPPLRFVEGAALAVVAAVLPAGLARLKATARSLHRRWADEDAGFSQEQGAVYVSESPVDDAFEALESVFAAVDGVEEYDSVERDAFAEGPGLTVTYSGFHNCFVRVTRGGRIVVTGASERTQTLADAVARACSVSFERTRDNPFEGVEPVRGAPRVFLGLLVFTVLLAGVNAVAAGAYPSDAYNPAERTVLVGMDAGGDLDPAASPAHTRLRKASFLVTVVDEEATEVRWEQNDSASIATHGRQALAVSGDARALLDAVREGSPTPAQTRRANRLADELREAERSVAAALTERAESDAVRGDTAVLRRLGDRLRANASESDGSGSTAGSRVSADGREAAPTSTVRGRIRVALAESVV